MTHLSKIITFLLLLLAISTHAQTQKGSNINGEAALDGSGESVSISSDGNTLAIGARNNDGAGISSGHVRIYQWGGSSWIQKGNDIDGESPFDASGSIVSLNSNGSTVAIGARGNDGGGNRAGHVRVYSWDGTNWIQKGGDIDGEMEQDESGWSVSISSDGNTVAIGAPYNSDVGYRAGHVRVYTWNDPVWIQKGIDIDGEAAEDESGYSVSMSSDGNTLAIGARYNDGFAPQAGHVRIYDWVDAAWVQKGLDIDGAAEGDYSGWSVSISSDGNTVAIGATENDDAGPSAGQVRVFAWDGTMWIQKGLDLDGETEYDDSGYSISLSSDGNTVAIGTPHNDGGIGFAGHVRVYFWDGTGWLQKGIDIDGYALNDKSGWSVSISSNGLTISVGAPYNDDEWDDAGQVRVYEFCEDITNSIAIEACNTFTVPSGDEIYTESGIYMDTIPRAFNCGDSILTIDITINVVNLDVILLAFDTLQADASGVGVSYQWIDCSDSSEIAGATEQTFGAPMNGNYAVIINQDGCVDTSACFEIEGVGISEILNNEIIIYPNPSSGLVYIQSANTEIESIKLYNSLGQLVMSWNITSTNAELNLKNFERGVYSLVIETSEGLVRKQIILN